jgi:hypothetical protein
MYLLLFLSAATKKLLRENKLPNGLTEKASLIRADSSSFSDDSPSKRKELLWICTNAFSSESKLRSLFCFSTLAF